MIVIGGVKMKNKLKLLLLPILVLSLTACGPKSDSPKGEESLKTAIEKTNKAKSFHMDYKIDMGAKSEGVEMEVPIAIGLDMDQKSNVAKLELSMSVLGMNISTTSFMDLKNNIMYTKQIGEEDSWTKQTLTNGYNSNMLGTYTKASKKDDTKDEYHYEVTISPEDFQKNLELLQTSGNSTDGLSLTKDVTMNVYVDKKTNYITKLEADLKDSVKLDDEDVEYTKLKFTVTYKDFDKVTVDAIDSSIIENAKSEE